MRKVLFITYYFPPAGGAGVQRATKFIKYLPEFGWQPVVLTVKENRVDLTDSNLMNEIPSDVSVYRTPALLFPGRFPWRVRRWLTSWILLIDQQIGWLPFAVAQGLDIIHNEGIDAIYTTSAPYTAHLIGLRLKIQTGLPWLADFRDPWVGNFSLKFPTRLHEKMVRKLEWQVCYHSSQVTVVSEPMRQSLLTTYPELTPDRVITLPNGYDMADFNDCELIKFDANQMVIVYTGSFYGSRRTPVHFFEALRLVLDDGRVPPEKIKIYFVGNIPSSVQEQISSMRLNDIIKVTGYLPHHESIRYLLGANILLLVIGAGPGSEAVFTGKIFEYLVTKKPVLALVPPGVAADLLTEAGVGFIVPPDDPHEIAEVLTKLYGSWSQGRLDIAPNMDVIKRYNRRYQAKQLAEAFNKIRNV